MNISADIQNAMTLAQSAPVKTPRQVTNEAAAKKAAGEFEGVLVSQMMGAMFEGISTDGPFGGGQGEAMFRSLMLDEYGKQVTKHGGLGLTDAITRSLLSHQEAKTNPAANINATSDANVSNPNPGILLNKKITLKPNTKIRSIAA
jgi:flagellar protein FlgJ